VKARERRATVAQHTHKRKGRTGATVAWRSLGLGLDIYNSSPMGDNVRYAMKQVIGERGNERSERSAGDSLRGVVWKRVFGDQKSERE